MASLKDINESIDGGKKTKGTNPLLDAIDKKLGPQQEYYADLNKRRGDRLEAERELKKSLKLGRGIAGVPVDKSGGADGGNFKLPKILKALGIGLASLSAAVAALKLKNAITNSTSSDGDKRTTRLLKNQKNLPTTNKRLTRTIDPSKSSFGQLRTSRLQSSVLDAELKINDANARIVKLQKTQADIAAARTSDARLIATANEKVRAQIAAEEVKIQKALKAKHAAELKLAKSRLIAVQKDAARLKFAIAQQASKQLVDIGQADRSFVKLGGTPPNIDEITQGRVINDPKLKHLSNADLKQAGYVRTSSGVRVLKPDGTAGKVVKHDTVLKAIQRINFMASGPTARLMSESRRTGNPMKGFKLPDPDEFDPRKSPTGIKHAASRMKGVVKSVAGGAIQVLDAPFTAGSQFARRLETSGTMVGRGAGSVISKGVRILGSAGFAALTVYFSGMQLASGEPGGQPLSTEFTKLMRALKSGVPVKQAKNLANTFVAAVKKGTHGINPAEEAVAKFLVDIHPFKDESFITFYKQIYKLMNPQNPILNVRLTKEDTIGSTGLSSHMAYRTAAKDFGLGVTQSFGNNPLQNQKILDSIRIKPGSVSGNSSALNPPLDVTGENQSSGFVDLSTTKGGDVTSNVTNVISGGGGILHTDPFGSRFILI